MKLDKEDVLVALKTISAPGEGENMVDSGAVKNIIVFGDEVIVDITISNPTLQAKKRTEVDIMKTIHERVYPKAKVVVNVKAEAPSKPKNEIKGKTDAELNNITERYVKNMPRDLSTWNLEQVHKDLEGKATQPAKMVLVDLLQTYLGVDMPVSYTSSSSNYETDTLFRKAELNPVYPFRILGNLISFKALNDVVETLPKKFKKQFAGVMGNAILGNGNARREMIKYIETNEAYRKSLPIEDLQAYLRLCKNGEYDHLISTSPTAKDENKSITTASNTSHDDFEDHFDASLYDDADEIPERTDAEDYVSEFGYNTAEF